MRAIHKATGLVVQVTAINTPQRFTGKVIEPGSTIWSKGNVVRMFEKEQFYIILSWNDINEITKTISILKETVNV